MEHKRSKSSNDTNFDVNMVDRISELPEHIIHEILSLLPTRDAAKTMKLSKKWKHIWSSFPILDLNQMYFGEDVRIHPDLKRNDPRILEISEKFMNFVDNTLLRYHQQKIPIQKLHLRLAHVDFNKACFVDKWIGLAIENLVKELSLHIVTENNRWYNLPQTIFAGKSITELKLFGCKLEPPISMNNNIKMCSLQKLLLYQVYIDEKMIQSLIYSCPLIDQLVLLDCWGFKFFQVSKPCKLRVVNIQRNEVQRVDIEAPSLEEFIYEKSVGFISCELNVPACQNLKFLHLRNASIKDQWLHDFIPKFPFLERLFIDRCNMLKRVIFSSHSLESFTLNGCNMLMEVEIVTPRLLEFEYFIDNKMPLVSLKDSQCEPRIMLDLSYKNHLDAYWFLKLREFLTSIVQNKILTLDIQSEKITFNIEELGETPLPAAYHVEELKLAVASSPLDYAALVDGLLWSCHPKTFSVYSEFESDKNFVKFLYEELMNREHQDCCISSHVKCWRHYLKDVRIQNFEGIEDGSPLHGDALLDILPNEDKVCFRLIWQP